MANYPFRINIATKSGKTIAFMTQSLSTDAETSISASAMVGKINLMPSASYENGASGSLLGADGFIFGNETDKGSDVNLHLSASYTHANTGSVIFTDKESATDSGLDYYTFWGTKVCSVLGVPEGIPIYTENFKLSDDSANPDNYLSGNVIADGIAIKESFKMAPQGRMRSNLVWDHQFGEGFLQWVSGSASKLLFGYDDQADTYSLSAASAATFNISGVDTLTADKVAADIIYDASGEDLVMVAGRTAWGSTAYDNGQLRLDSTHDQGGIARNQMIGGFRIDYQEHDAWDNESVLYDYGLRINNRTAGDVVDTFAGISFDVGTERDDDSIAGAIAVLRNDTTDTSHAGNMIFATNNAGDDGLTERLRITHDGNVGIGTSTPMNKMQINHTQSDGDDGLMIVLAEASITSGEWLGGIGFDGTDGNVPSSVLESSAYIGAVASETHGVSDKGGHLVFGTAALNENDDLVSNEVGRWTDGGNLLIGRTTEAATSKDPVLECDGGISFDGFLSRAGTGGSNNGANWMNFYWDGSYIDGWVDTTEVWPNETSDYRIKENVTTMTGSFDNGILKKVNELRPINYTQKSCSIWTQSDDARVSFLAHEMADVFPNIVKGEYNATGSDGQPLMQSYNNTHLTTYLVKAVQELTQAHNHLIAAITGSTDLNHLKASVTGSLIG